VRANKTAKTDSVHANTVSQNVRSRAGLFNQTLIFQKFTIVTGIPKIVEDSLRFGLQ